MSVGNSFHCMPWLCPAKTPKQRLTYLPHILLQDKSPRLVVLVVVVFLVSFKNLPGDVLLQNYVSVTMTRHQFWITDAQSGIYILLPVLDK
jgi:hypothetical protein